MNAQITHEYELGEEDTYYAEFVNSGPHVLKPQSALN